MLENIITPLGMDETSEWHNCFVLVPKLHEKVWPCLDLARLNQTLISLVHRKPSVNDIFPKLTNAKNMTLIDASSRFACQVQLVQIQVVTVWCSPRR